VALSTFNRCSLAGLLEKLQSNITEQLEEIQDHLDHLEDRVDFLDPEYDDKVEAYEKEQEENEKKEQERNEKKEREDAQKVLGIKMINEEDGDSDSDEDDSFNNPDESIKREKSVVPPLLSEKKKSVTIASPENAIDRIADRARKPGARHTVMAGNRTPSQGDVMRRGRFARRASQTGQTGLSMRDLVHEVHEY